jgi:hypothetical protein
MAKKEKFALFGENGVLSEGAKERAAAMRRLRNEVGNTSFSGKSKKADFSIFGADGVLAKGLTEEQTRKLRQTIKERKKYLESPEVKKQIQTTLTQLVKERLSIDEASKKLKGFTGGATSWEVLDEIRKAESVAEVYSDLQSLMENVLRDPTVVNKSAALKALVDGIDGRVTELKEKDPLGLSLLYTKEG